MKLTKRAQKITPFYVMELLEKAKEMEAQGEHIVHLEVGEPDFPTPELIKEKAINAIQDNRTFYTHSLGLYELRERIARHYQEKENVAVSPGRIIITNGTSGAFLLLFATLLERGGVLGISDPGYPCYKNFGVLFDAGILPIPVSVDSHFEITAEQLKKMKKIPNLFAISNPSNPSGIVYREGTLDELYSYLSYRDSLLIVDEIYSGLSYGRKAKTALTIADDIIVINGFSKTFAMTGWRLGWMVVPQSLVRPIQNIAQNVFISPPTISQYAALFAFETEDELALMRQTYNERRGFLLPRLKELGFRIPVDPEGAFYIYAGIEKWGLDSMEFTERALSSAKVACTPGYDFGSFRASSHIRFTYASSIEMLKVGCERLKVWLKTL